MKTYNGMEVIVSDTALAVTDVKSYLKTRNMSQAKIARMQKKWHKRYGQILVPTVWEVNRGNRQYIVIHPKLYGRFTSNMAGGV